MAINLRPGIRVFAKLADRPAPGQCRLDVWRMEFGVGDGAEAVRVFYFDVVPSAAYGATVRRAAIARELVQVGLVFPDGRRRLLTGAVEIQPPSIIGAQVLHRIRMDVRRDEWCQP